MSEPDCTDVAEALEHLRAEARTGKYRFVAVVAIHADADRATCAVVGRASDAEILDVLNALAVEALEGDEVDPFADLPHVRTGQA